MPDETQGNDPSSAASHQWRERTSFRETSGFQRAVRSLGVPGRIVVPDEAKKYETAWRLSRSNEDIPPGFRFQKLDALPGRYELREIWATSGYRAAVMFLYGTDTAFWIHAWKKSKQNNREHVRLAASRARRLWDEEHGG